VKTKPAVLLALALGLAPTGAGPAAAQTVSSRGYKGHESDRDITAFVNAYPRTVGTRLDDCQTCHRGGVFTETRSGRTTTKNPCDYCHLVQHPAPGLAGPAPADFHATLNAYGLAYLAAGRSVAALRRIDRLDSDGDGARNGVEIAALRYPGDSTSRPGQPSAPARTFTAAELRALPQRTEFVLVNASRQGGDFYATYSGVSVRDLLTAAGVDPDAPGFGGVTVVAPDGYVTDFTARQVAAAAAPGTFFAGLDSATLGACGFVRYPRPLPAGLVPGAPIPGEAWLLLASGRDGGAMDVTTLDPATGRLEGEGPFRLVVPPAAPGAPDRGSSLGRTACNDGWDYDAAKDHNAGGMVRGVVAVRVNPLPAGVEDFDTRNGGWAFVANGSVVVYGAGVRAR